MRQGYAAGRRGETTHLFERLPQPLRVDQIRVRRFVDCGFQLAGRQAECQIREGPHWTRYGDAAPGSAIQP
jgi:hypothetical protein